MGVLDTDVVLGLLDSAHRNHNILANNLANVSTPGYRAMRVRFARQLDDILDERGRLLPGRQMETEVYSPLFADAGPDGNDVTLEREIVELNKNSVRLRLYLAVLRSRVQRLRYAIEGR